jgi:pimeloyl-ACP methyl ester carboxylesterase
MRDAAASIQQAGHAPATFAQIEHAGHAPFLTHVDEVVAQLAPFLSGSVAQ